MDVFHLAPTEPMVPMESAKHVIQLVFNVPMEQLITVNHALQASTLQDQFVPTNAQQDNIA